MVANAESSRPSVNERLARAREEDLRRCRNLQAKLARQDAQDFHLDLTPKQHSLSEHASMSSHTGLMILSATEVAKRESYQRSRERQLKRQVAGPIPPQSWRDDFDRLSIRRGVASDYDRKRLQDLVSSTTGVRDDDSKSQDRQRMQRTRKNHARVCAGLRYFQEQDEDGIGGQVLSLRDMSLCIIADALNRPALPKDNGKNRVHGLVPEMDRTQLRDVLEYLPKHMQQRMMALCGGLALTHWPLSEWTAQALIDLDKPDDLADHNQADASEDTDEDWEASSDSDLQCSTLPRRKDGGTTLDLSYSAVSARTIHRLLSTASYTAVSLTTLSLAGFSTPSSLDSPAMHSIFAQLPNLQFLSLAGSHLSRDGSGMDEDLQRASIFLRKLSRSCTKLETLDLSFCRWVSADAVLAVSWATKTTVSWPQLGKLLLFGCEALADPRAREELVAFDGTSAASWVAPWHATHSQRANGTEMLYDAVTDTVHRDPFDLFFAPAARSAARARFSDYVNGTIQPPIITHMTPSRRDADGHAEPNQGVLMEYVRCPRSAGKVEMWQWQRARILEAVRGRSQPSARQRRWIDVYF